ncbi:MAG: MdtA/MuxA family multidrug efflux RND transporter periplasmic adaptor subunit [Methylococcales bacterium]
MNQDPPRQISAVAHKRSYIWLGFLLIAAIILGAGYFLYPFSVHPTKVDPKADSSGHGDDDAPVPVSVQTAGQADFPVYLNGLGTVTALRTVTVRPRVDGIVERVTFTEGQLVKAGQLLAEIDPRPFQIQLQQAQGQLMRDEALLKNAEIDYQRYQTLLEQDSIAAQQTTTQASQVKQYRGIVEMDKAQVANAKLQLDYAQVSAPISGQVGLRQIDQGNLVHANDSTGLVVITQLQPISVVFNLPEDKVQAVLQRWRVNQNIHIEAYDRAGKNKLAEGKLLALDNQIDASTGTLKLKAQFDNNDGTLFANQFVNIKMHLDTLSAVTLISSAAVQNDSQGAFVYVLNADKKAQIRRISLGPSDGDQVVVLANLSAGELVVSAGVDQLHEGSLVDVAEKDGQAVAAGPELLNKFQGGKHRKKDRR